MPNRRFCFNASLIALMLAGCSGAVPGQDEFGREEVGESTSELAIAHTVRLKIVLLKGASEGATDTTELDNFKAARADQILNGMTYEDSNTHVMYRDENGLRDVFASSGIDFDFDFARDVTTVVDNELRDDCVRTAPGAAPSMCYEYGYGVDAAWNKVHPKREALAKSYRGAVVLFLRLRTDCGESSSQTDKDCRAAHPYWVPRRVVDPVTQKVTRETVAVGQGHWDTSFITTIPFIADNGTAHYSHEIGHWLGALPHTFEDDGCADTDDPGAEKFYLAACKARGTADATCTSNYASGVADVNDLICKTKSATVDGRVVTPDKGNALSYYNCRATDPTFHFSACQTDKFNTRLASGLKDLTKQYENLGDVSQRPTGLAVGVNDLHMFAVGTDRRGYDKSITSSGGWWPSERSDGWADLGGDLASPISACSWAAGRIDLVARSSSGRLLMKNYGNSSWYPSLSTWQDMGAGLVGTPKIVTWGPNRLDVFARNASNHIVHKTWNGSSWYPSQTTWTDLGGNSATDPVAVSWGSGRLDVFMTDSTGTLKSKSFGNGAWSPSETGWYDLGTKVSGEPAVVSWGSGRLDIFVRDSVTGNLKGKNFSGSWYPSQFEWFDMGGPIVGSPSAVTWGANRLDIFALSTNGAIMGKTFAAGTWAPSLTGFYTTVAGSFTTAPSAVSWGAGRIDLFARANTNAAAHRAFRNNTAWWPIGG